MSATWLILLFIAVFVAIAVLIVRLKINPAISLLLGTVVLGLASKMNFGDIIEGINGGFGELMMEVGLLISLGVIMGTLMSSYGAVERIVGGILKIFRAKGSPYALAFTLSSITPAIYFDVLLVLVSPIARSVARRTGRPLASTAGPMAMGLAAANGFVVPGAAVLAYIGALGMPASEALLPALALVIPTVMVTTFLYVFAIERLHWWKPETDEDPALSKILDEAMEGEDHIDFGGDSSTTVSTKPKLMMITALAPILVVLVMILSSIILNLLGIEIPVIDFIGAPVIAMLAGAMTALIISAVKGGLSAQESEVNNALETVGTILVVTAVSGSLGAIIAGTGMRDVLAGLFEATSFLPLLAVWAIAAIMRMAIGGQTVAGITAIGIISPLIATLGLSPVLVLFAAGAGGCFGGQFSDNAFWMLQRLFGLSTKGTLKTYTLAQSMLSVVILLVVLLLDIFI